MEDSVSNTVLIIAFSMLLAALVLAFARLLKGPSINDRIAAMDLIAAVVMGFVLVYSVMINKSIYFDIPVIISLISFIGTVAVSTYLKHRYG
ncbi:multisubunit sodium/proton antiporter, MrpF subunit [Tangfeifania diversioriginum]|uniref:Multisubunit sodium/proton antiporter, MrpF subunit n=1 Tax=Tangfeifania diversioriginum TaxID=1168035 RepID=A0A1M6IP09_9BACT|nr:monovalent cation/H+ antiporter complex subunit F [Tangfeifania diversioriginum]SHJ36180.1 multisubunit sodium/proton antiporter, MrpF subunit [Tangfeifania diversioriginum]